MQITLSSDCGNSPKNATTERIGVALECQDIERLSGVFNEQSRWCTPAQILVGDTEIIRYLSDLSAPEKLQIDRVASHGKVGVVNGVVVSGNTQRRFCHLIEYSSVKCQQVARIESYQG